MPSVLIHGGKLLRHVGGSQTIVDGDLTIRGNLIEADAPDPGATAGHFDTTIDATNQLVIPGFVNAHTHSYANLSRGLHDGLPLEALIPFGTATTLGRTRREGYVSAMLGAVEHLLTGTTSVLDHLGGSLESQVGALEAYRDVGLRVAMAPMVADVPFLQSVPLDPGELAAVVDPAGGHATPGTGQIVEELRELLETWHRPEERTRVLLGPLGPQRCSAELLAICRELSDRFETGVHTHLLESRIQAQKAKASPDGSLVERLDRAGLVNERLSGAHAVWCSEEELERLAVGGATLVHNPWSNLTLGSGIAPLPAWRRSGVVRALGTDGANCGGNLSMFRAMALAAALSRPSTPDVAEWPTVDEILTMSAEGGARALQLEGRIGRIEPGYLADLAILDTTSVPYAPAAGRLGQLVHGDMGGSVRTVLVDGRVVLGSGRIAGVDVPGLLAEAEAIVARLMSDNEPLFRTARAQQPLMLDLVRRNHL